MLEVLLGVEKLSDISGVSFRGPSSAAPAWLAAVVLIAAAVALAVYLYRSEDRLSPSRRAFMMVCQGLALLMLVIVLLDPVADIKKTNSQLPTMLVLVDTSASMQIDDERRNPEDIALAAQILGKLPLNEQPAGNEIERLRGNLGDSRRIDLARAALAHPDIKLLENLEENYNVRFFSFGEELRPEGGAENPTQWLETVAADGASSRVGDAIEEAVGRYRGQDVAGVVVVSDFAWLDGADPVNVAGKMKQLDIPVYTVPVGLPDPPDVIVQRVIAPEVVFKGDNVPLRVQINATGFAGKTVDLTFAINGQHAETKQVELIDGVQFAELMFKPRGESGNVTLEIAASPLTGETSTENNSQSPQVQVIEEKIKVLYVEGMPRWEYRYLRWVLLRDPRLDVHFLMAQGDPALAEASDRHIASFPQDTKDVLKYDLIIMGDVPATAPQLKGKLELIEELVKTSGGSLLMIAGPMGAPASYRDTPIEKMLPVKLGGGQWESVGSDVYPVVTDAGRESPATALSPSPEANDRIWSHVRPLYALPQLGGAKSGATVLLSIPKDVDELPDYPLVAWQRYGNGKCLFVATEDLWRMRLEVGDRYHARFWGQTIQFLALSRLLGQNKQISLETERRDYNAGEYVQIYANVLTESFEPIDDPTFPVLLEYEGEVAEIELDLVPNSKGLYSGVHMATTDGQYKLRSTAAYAEVSNEVQFRVATTPQENRITAMQHDVARQVAERSGGKSLALTDLATLPEELGEQAPTVAVAHLQKELWDAPLLFLMLVAFAGTEWFLRRRDNLV